MGIRSTRLFLTCEGAGLPLASRPATWTQSGAQEGPQTPFFVILSIDLS